MGLELHAGIHRAGSLCILVFALQLLWRSMGRPPMFFRSGVWCECSADRAEFMQISDPEAVHTGMSWTCKIGVQRV